MQTRLDSLPAFADYTTQDVLRQSIENAMAHVVRNDADLRSLIDSLRHEHPNLTVQASGGSKPNAVNGALLLQTNPLSLAEYNSALLLWLGPEVEVSSQNKLAPVTAGSYVVSALVGIVANAAYTTTLTITDTSGATVASQTVNGSAGYQDVTIAIAMSKVTADAFTFASSATLTILPRLIIRKIY